MGKRAKPGVGEPCKVSNDPKYANGIKKANEDNSPREQASSSTPFESEFGTQIFNRDLERSDIPSADADWGILSEFALTFDGYQYWVSTEKCASIANAKKHASLAELRTCLFFEQRRHHHFGEAPDKKTMVYIRKVIEQIRSRVIEGKVD